MSEAEQTDQIQYVVTDENGKTKIQEEGYIQESTIGDITFRFDPPKEITESTASRAKGKPPVTYTKKGRSAYSPGGPVYPDGNTSATMVVMKCILQYTEAFKSPNYSYGKNFVNIGIEEYVIDKIIDDAKRENQMNLAVKPKVENLNGHYWPSCNLDKLTKANTHILLESGGGRTVEYDLDKMLIEFKQSIEAIIVFTLSAVMNNDNMDEALDLADGQYYVSLKPVEIWAIKESDVEGPKLSNTNARKNEGADVTGHLYAGGRLAELAMKKLKLSGK